MSAEAYLKPQPEPSPESKPYWDGLLEGRLMLQSCGSCGKVRHYPRPMCAACHSFEVKWIEASGKGKVHSWTETHHAFNPGFKGELPYVLVTVDLAEGVRVNAPLRGTPVSKLVIGMAVKLVIERPRSDLALPAFVAA
jgi:hypothetical protein